MIALPVDEGDFVATGQRLAVVEAMKMEHAFVALRAGRATRLAAKLGDVVEQGQRVMTIASGDEQAKFGATVIAWVGGDSTMREGL